MTSSQDDPEDPTPASRVGRTTLALTPVVILARGLSFVVPVAMAHLFGVTSVTDAFFYALAVPTFLLIVVANTAGTVATPIMATSQEQDPASLPRFVGSLCSVACLVALLFGATACLVLSFALPQVSDFDSATQRLSVQHLAELIPFMVLAAPGVILRSACEVRGRFLPIAIAPMIRASMALFILFACHSWLGSHTLPAAIAIGEAAQFSWYLWTLRASGVHPEWTLRLDPRVKVTALSMVPLIGGEILVAANILVDKGFAGGLESGSVALLEFADRMRLIPQTLLESTLVPVAFATWANLVAKQHRRDFAGQVDQSLRWVAAWSAPPLAGLYIGRYVLASWLFERGAFSETDAVQAAEVFGWYIPGLWAMMLGILAVRAHIVESRLFIVFWLGLTSMILNALLNYLLIGPFGLKGLAMASSLVWWIVPMAYLLALWPTVRGHIQWVAWCRVVLIVTLSGTTASVIEYTGNTPTSIGDPALWGAALLCFALLGLASLWAGKPRGVSV